MHRESSMAAVRELRELVWYLVVAGLLLGAAGVWAADEESPAVPSDVGFQEVVDVNLVNVDVYVRDGKGEPVTGLSGEDFVLLQDGERVKISHFAEVTEEIVTTRFAASPPALTPTPTPVEPSEIRIRPVWMILYIDNENLHPNSRTRVLRRVRQFVTETLKPPVQMMVVANQGGLKVLQDFTDDPRAVNGALRGAGKYAGGWLDRKSRRTELIEEMRDVQTSTSTQNQNSDNGPMGMYARVMAHAREENNALTFSLNALRQAIDALSGLRGRKMIIYVSNGLAMTPGLGLMHEYALVFKDNSILSNRARFDRQATFHSLTSVANSQEIVFYSLGAEGLEVNLGGDVDSMYASDPTATRVGASNFLGSLRYLAERTGGIAVVNTNDVSAGLQEIRSDLFTYYSIGFPVSSDEIDRVHKIKVELASRKDVDLRYRNRFVEKSLETTIQDQVLSGLVLGVEDNPMGIRVDHGRPAPASGTLWTVPIRIFIPMEKLVFLPRADDRVARGVLFFGSKDSQGGRSDLQRQRHELVAGPDDATDGNWTIELQLLMEEGGQRVVVAFLDEMTRDVSYSTLNLTVP